MMVTRTCRAKSHLVVLEGKVGDARRVHKSLETRGRPDDRLLSCALAGNPLTHSSIHPLSLLVAMVTFLIRARPVCSSNDNVAHLKWFQSGLLRSFPGIQVHDFTSCF